MRMSKGLDYVWLFLVKYSSSFLNLFFLPSLTKASFHCMGIIMLFPFTWCNESNTSILHPLLKKKLIVDKSMHFQNDNIKVVIHIILTKFPIVSRVSSLYGLKSTLYEIKMNTTLSFYNHYEHCRISTSHWVKEQVHSMASKAPYMR